MEYIHAPFLHLPTVARLRDIADAKYQNLLVLQAVKAYESLAGGFPKRPIYH
ncbi:hypothetical protein [Nodularia sp. NIES-3585]|uniref:hypothetical protein n=1 Tax=Nodularia sp. NIES-3585 TaxID=1973477 RepID=UPI0015958432|nr:hypothetical protein [Nodularia sp. NIES-3585]